MNIHELFPAFYIDREYDTYNDREELKRLGFRWDPEKKQWWHKDKAERDNAQQWLLQVDYDDPMGNHWEDSVFDD